MHDTQGHIANPMPEALKAEGSLRLLSGNVALLNLLLI